VLILYCACWCPKCLWVEDNLRDLGVAYKLVRVEREPKDRKALLRDTGQRGIPALVDGDKVFLDEWDIVRYAKEVAARQM
jgi:glutaredoxin